MTQVRPAIEAELRRRVLVEAGHRCAVPACRQTPVEVAHIQPWCKTRNHEFDNLIALCPTCHARYDNGEIDRKAMRIYKAQLAKGTDFDAKLGQRIERLEKITDEFSTEPTGGFSSAVLKYYNRACNIGFVDGKRFVTVGVCTFVKPRTAIVPGRVIEMITEVLKVRSGTPAIWEASGITKFRESSAPRKHGDLRLVEAERKLAFIC